MDLKLTPSTAEYGGEQLFQVEGTVRDLQVARSTEHLLSQIQNRGQHLQGVAGAALAADDMHGMAANAASLIFYDGEDMINFACYLDDKLVGGIFPAPFSIADGDYLLAVVSRRGGMYFVHGVIRPADHSAWMPLNIYQGKKAFFRSCMRMARGATIFTACVMPIGQFIFNWPWWGSASLVIFNFFLATLFELWTYKDFRYFSERAAAIFSVFGFPDPDELDLTKGIPVRHSHASLNGPAVEGSYNYVAVITKHLEAKERIEVSKRRPTK